jgi:hypothetical protein
LGLVWPLQTYASTRWLDVLLPRALPQRRAV